jgi:uncharacterized protein (DUF1684 family)
MYVSRFRFLALPLSMRAFVALIAAFGWVPASESASFAIGSCANEYRQCLEKWKVDRVAYLKSEEGYLNLVGLFWLGQGQSTFGSDAGNDLVFPGAALAEMGSFELGENGVAMHVRPGADIRVDGEPVSRAILSDDSSEKPAVATSGSLAWTVIRRDDRVAVRLRDFQNPVLFEFAPIDYFPTDETLRVEAKLERYDKPRIVRVDTVVEGLDYNPSSPGLLQFEIGGKSFELEAYDAGEEFLIVFGDTTSGRETYPAGRFLYTDKPDKDDRILLDFNTAQNPPCAFNEFATCPVASPRNRLAIRIAAGERYDPSGH